MNLTESWKNLPQTLKFILNSTFLIGFLIILFSISFGNIIMALVGPILEFIGTIRIPLGDNKYLSIIPGEFFPYFFTSEIFIKNLTESYSY